jgi:hypothetical protein
MKKLGLWLGLLAASLAPASAQVTVEVLLDQDQFLPGEALVAAVRVTNLSGQKLPLGGEPDWLTFAIEARDSEVVPKNGEAPVAGEFVLESSQMGTKRVDLAPYFSISRPGRYAIVATVRIKAWDREITSPPKTFYMIEGAKLWEQQIGMPPSANSTNATPEVRRYILQQVNYLKGQLRLYLRLTDATGGKAFKVLPIGPMLSFSRPQPLVDRASNLHILYQNGPHSYSYTAYNPEGDLIVRRIYDYIDSRPRLREGNDGVVSVTGGVLRTNPNGESTNPPPVAPPDLTQPLSRSNDVKLPGP